MIKDGKILVGKSSSELKEVYLLPEMSNRHGLIAGATGTGKTVTLKVLAEGFSELGVPVFLADIKGDLSGMCKKGEESENVSSRINNMELDNFTYRSYPTSFFDVLAEKGHPVRATISDMGPVLLGRLLGLSDVQEGVLNIVFKVADNNGLLLEDLKDLRAMVQYVGENNKEFTLEYGNVTQQSIGAIQRALLKLEDEGGNLFFGEPMFDITDFMFTDSGEGMINILNCEKLYRQPLLYSTFLLWLISELFELLPEQGDSDKPKMVFFFDEAHLLFNDAPKALIQQIETTVKLIRSKGVGIFFITQNPMDVPDSVLAQLNNRIQHSLRAYTPAELKNVKVAAQSFRENPAFKTEDVITELKTGEALVSCLDEDGKPNVVEITTVCPPQSYMGIIDEDRLQAVVTSSELYGKYETMVDNESAYEKLQEVRAIQEKDKAKQKSSGKKSTLERTVTNATSTFTRAVTGDLVKTVTGLGSTSRKNPLEKTATSIINSLSREVGNTLTRGLFGVLTGKK